MKKSKFTILLLFLVMILAISAASAADLDDTSDSAVQAADEASVDEVASADVDDVVSTDSGADVVADPAVSTSKNFTQLKDDIASSHGYLPLASNYVRVAGEKDIEITSSLVIAGNDEYYIDANYLGGIFKITNTESVVVLNNVILKNGNSTNGGAIYNEGTLTISSSQLTNNNASSGGAIYNTGHLIINSGSALNGNTAINNGGAIYSKGTTVVETATFENNKVTNGYDDATNTGGSQGGAIYALGESLEIKDSTFLENSATPDDHGEGAAIYAEVTTTTISGTTFKSNKGFQGGAVKLIGVDQDTLVFNNCTFDSNIALQGGAIDAQGCANLRINDTLFIDNQAYSDRYSGINPDMGAAAAIGAAYVNDIVIYVNNSKFIHNTVTSGPTENSGFGAAIISTGSLIVDNTEFTDNEADKFATLRVYHNGNAGTVTITNSNFTGNKANKGDAAVLYTSASKTATVDNCRFEDNTAVGNGGAIYADGALNVKNSYFKNNIANNTANAIYANNALTLSGNTIDGDAAEIIANGEVNSQINVTILNNGTVDTYADSVTVNATITDDKGNVIANATGFKFVVDGVEAVATYDAVNKIYTGSLALPGPGIYTVNINYTEQDKLKVKTGTIKNYRGTFIDLNKTIANGQDLQYDFKYTPELGDDVFVNGIEINTAVTINGNGHTISGSNAARIFNVTASLTLTNVTLTNGKADNGGAIYVANGATLDADYANFTDNTATYKGGAVYSEGDVKVNHTVFDNNNITKNDGTSENNYGGAAIYNVDGALTVDNSVIKNNQKDYKYGITEDNGDKVVGVITTTGTVRITNSNFTGNKGRWGSSITMTPLTSNTVASIIIDNCNFTDNIAYQGGAVQFYDLELEFTINNCWFENNSAFGKGSGIYTANGGALSIFISQTVGKGTINGTTFINNQVQDVSVRVPDKYLCGGAVVLDGKSFTVENSVFINNFAEKGSAIHIVDGRLTVDNVTFDSNEATVGGAAIWAFDNIDVKNSRFINNNATEGGAIYFSKYATSSTVNNSNFTDNKAVNGGAIYITEEDKVKHWLPAVTITDSKFDGNTATGEGNAIYNLGKLTLARNTLSKEQADIVSNGEVASTIIIVVMNNGTAYHFANITLQANVTDDNYNPMEITGLNLTVNDTANTQLSVKYNPATGLHEGTYTPIEVGKFNIGATYITTTAQLDITTANITIAKSLIDIQNMINAANAGDIINLTGDYSYVPEFDSSIVNGIKVNKAITIDGKGYTISGSNAARIFDVVTGGDLTLINVTLTEGKGTFYNGGYSGGAIRMGLNTNLTVKDSKFVNNTVDFGGAIYSTADNVNINITDSEFINNTANYMVGAIMVSGDNTNVTITGSNFTANKGIMFGEAGAIYVQDVNSFKVDNCNFINNTADQGAAIDIAKYAGSDFEVVITNSNFTDNSAKAVLNYKNGNVTIEDSTFTNNGGATDYAISNSGTLSLSGNKIDNLIYSSGKIASTIKVEVLGGEVKTINTLEANLYAKVTDDKGNLIKDTNFKFTINDEEVPAVYNATSKLYEATYPLPTAGIYPVNITYVTTNKLEVKNATIKSTKGTFTDLKEKLAVAGDVVLPYNFTYTPIIDGDNFPTISINKVIDGNGFTIDANGASINIFTVDIGNTATLKNMVITGVNMSSTVMYGAVINKGSLTVDNVTFIDNKINRVNGNDAGVAIWNNGNSLTVIGSKFINNTSPYNFEATSGQTIRDSVGAIHSVASSGVSIRDSYFERNIGRWGAAITFENFNQASAAVENCTFYNNTAYQGGAININWGCSVVNVTNCTFDSNSYIGPNGDNTHGANGGAISSGYGTLLLSDSIFKNNKGDDSYISSGAAVSFSDGAGGQIINCTFENNVDLNGAAAIDVGDVNGAAASVTIKDSRFINNIANGKSPVHINAGVTAEVENCTFEGTQSTYDIYNEGTLTLTKNTLPKGVYSNGTVKSPVINATLIGGKNITAALYDEVYPSATLTDDKGNAIYDPNFNITVDGVALKTDYDKETGLYNATYFIESAGDKLVNTTYTTVGLVITTGTYKVDKANVTEFIVVVVGETGRILYGENATVEIILLGVNGEKLNVTDMVVIVNNNPYKVNITNGTGSFNVTELLVPGNYAALANFAGNSNYNAKYATGVFTVLSPDLGLEVTISDFTYLDDAVIEVTVGDDTFSGIVTVTIDDEEYLVPVILGEGTLSVSDIDAGVHTYNATFAGDETYAPVQTSNKEFKVGPTKVFIEIVPENEVIGVNYGEAGAIVVIIEDEEGNRIIDNITLIFSNETGVLATVEGKTSDTHSYMGNDNVIELPFTADWKMGIYNITVGESQRYTFMQKVNDVYKFTSYNNEEKETMYSTGTVSILDEGDEYIKVKVLTNDEYPDFVGNIYYIKNDEFDLEGNTAYQLYDEDENPVDIWVTVSESEPEEFEFAEYEVHKVYIYNDDVNVTEGDGWSLYGVEHNMTLKLTLNGELVDVTCNGNVSVVCWDEYGFIEVTDPFEVEFINGVAKFTLPALDEGNYMLKVSIDDEIYQLAGWEDDYGIVDYALVSDLDVVHNEVEIPESSVNGIEDGVYLNERIFNFTVYHSFIDENGDEIYEVFDTYTTSATVNISRWNEDDEKFVLVDTKVIAVTNGVSEDVDLTNLGAGIYNVAIYIDDGNFTIFGEYGFNVDKATPEVTVTVEVLNGTYPGKVNVTVAGVDGTYSLAINGVAIDEQVIVSGGTGNVVVDGLAAGENVVTASIDETDNYTEGEGNSDSFTIINADVVFNATVTTPVAYPNDVIVTVNTTVAGNVSIFISSDKSYLFYVEAGVTDLPISDLSVGTYPGIIVHFEADNYNAADDDITFEVTKGTPEFNVTAIVAKDTYPGAVTIIVTSDINAKFNVTVGDETKEVEVTNGIGYETFTGVAADIDNATVTFIEDTHYKETSKVEKFTAIAKSAPEFSVTPVLIVDTYKGKVNITISGVDGTYSIQINDVGTNALPIRGEIIVSGGKGSKVFENLTAGDKEVTATIDESANYTAGEGFATFTVKKATIEIEPKATGEFIVDGKINVTFKLPTDIDGTVIVYVDGVADPQAPTSVEGVYTIEFDAFNAGSHTFVATLTGDSNYADAMGQTTFDVEKVNVTISIAPDNSVPNPESILIKVADNATGTILVEIPGYLTLQNYEIENGTYTLDLGPIPADDYEIFVTYMGDDKYNNGSANATFTIVKLASPEVIVNITDTAIVGEKDVVVNITVGDNFANPGNVTVYVDGIPVQTVAIDEYGNVIVTIPALENGTHTIGVKYNGNNYFNASDIVNKTVTVTKAASSVTIDPIDNVTYGKTVVIKYTIVNETDYVTVLVTDESGKSYERTVEDGVITVEGIIPAGKYTVSIHNGESGFYTESEANATFYVTEGPKIDIKVAENTTAPTFNITLPEDATGYVLVDVDGKQYYAPLVNGSATIQTEPLAGGNHTINVTYTGDSKYPGFSNSTNVTIDSNITADSAFDIPTSTETSSPTFSINLPSDATGYLLVDVDGKKYAAVVENGTASITVPGLTEGNHNVTVSYTGDGKYPALSKDATVNVHIPVYKITENKNINVLYSASASYKVLITKDGKAVGAGETVTIKYNGKTYNVKTDSKGYATLKLSTKVKVKSYTITATYQGVSVKNTVKVKHVIKASNKKVKKSRKVTKIKITLRKVNNKYLAKKTIKVKFKGKTYKVKTNKKGVATWKVKKSMVKKLKVGKKYKYRVTYGKDVLTKKLTIKR